MTRSATKQLRGKLCKSGILQVAISVTFVEPNQMLHSEKLKLCFLSTGHCLSRFAHVCSDPVDGGLSVKLLFFALSYDLDVWTLFQLNSVRQSLQYIYNWRLINVSFQFILSGEYQQNFDLNFKQGLRDITTEEGHYVLESFCQNVEVVS